MGCWRGWAGGSPLQSCSVMLMRVLTPFYVWGESGRHPRHCSSGCWPLPGASSQGWAHLAWWDDPRLNHSPPGLSHRRSENAQVFSELGRPTCVSAVMVAV